jgi:Secretion system C-terminal sorting domain
MLSINKNNTIATFAIAEAGNCKIEIMDHLGSVIETLIIQDSNIELNFSKYTSGNYSIKLETQHQTILKSFRI